MSLSHSEFEAVGIGGGGVERCRIPAARRFRSCRNQSRSIFVVIFANDGFTCWSCIGMRIFS
jgi:hypothetical protein